MWGDDWTGGVLAMRGESDVTNPGDDVGFIVVGICADVILEVLDFFKSDGGEVISGSEVGCVACEER